LQSYDGGTYRYPDSGRQLPAPKEDAS